MTSTHVSGTTSLSLLQGMRQRDPLKWERFVHLYGPVVYGWCRRAGVPEQDAAHVTQEVFRAVATGLERFHRDQAGDSFRGWLWSIAHHKIKDHFRQRRQSPPALGGSEALEQLHHLTGQLPDDWSQEQQLADERLVLHRALQRIGEEFESRTWQAFWRITVEDQMPLDAAADLGMSVGAVYNAKYKVLRRLRQELEGLIEAIHKDV